MHGARFHGEGVRWQLPQKGGKGGLRRGGRFFHVCILQALYYFPLFIPIVFLFTCFRSIQISAALGLLRAFSSSVHDTCWFMWYWGPPSRGESVRSFQTPQAASYAAEHLCKRGILSPA